MQQLSRSQLAVYAVLVVVVALVGYRYIHGGSAVRNKTHSASRSGTVKIEHGSSDQSGLTVHVAGAVRKPGVYKLKRTARVKDAVKAAGGSTKVADLNAINLAAKLDDGRQVVVPTGLSKAVAIEGDGNSSANQAASHTPAGAGGGAPINLNTATVEQLDQLEGVGETTAQKILEYRQQHGGFSSIDDLDKIPGIGEKRIETLRTQATV